MFMIFQEKFNNKKMTQEVFHISYPGKFMPCLTVMNDFYFPKGKKLIQNLEEKWKSKALSK